VIVRLALDMGLRSSETAHLMIGDIDWRAGTVTLRGTKSLRQDVMPLPMACGQALADYLQHERLAISPGRLCPASSRARTARYLDGDPEGDQTGLPS
jgi:integrase